MVSFFFFFQAEDGIRDYKVTGVQTCALPIWKKIARRAWRISENSRSMSGGGGESFFVGGSALPGTFGEYHVSMLTPPARLIVTGVRSSVFSASPWSAPVARALSGFGVFCLSACS